jgi:hypothetical protein
VINIYKEKGHTVTEVKFMQVNMHVHTILADNAFEAIRMDMEEYGVMKGIIHINLHFYL